MPEKEKDHPEIQEVKDAIKEHFDRVWELATKWRQARKDMIKALHCLVDKAGLSADAMIEGMVSDIHDELFEGSRADLKKEIEKYLTDVMCLAMEHEETLRHQERLADIKELMNKLKTC